MREVVRGMLALGLLLGTARWVNAKCAMTQAEIDAAIQTADGQCAQESPPASCTTATSHGQYVSCISHKVNDNTAVPPECRGAVKRCAARSTCGKQSFITCCKTKSDGTTKCSTKHDALGDGTICTDHAPPGGSACVGHHPSCCDACTSSGCAP